MWIRSTFLTEIPSWPCSSKTAWVVHQKLWWSLAFLHLRYMLMRQSRHSTTPQGQWILRTNQYCRWTPKSKLFSTWKGRFSFWEWKTLILRNRWRDLTVDSQFSQCLIWSSNFFSNSRLHQNSHKSSRPPSRADKVEQFLSQQQIKCTLPATQILPRKLAPMAALALKTQIYNKCKWIIPNCSKSMNMSSTDSDKKTMKSGWWKILEKETLKTSCLRMLSYRTSWRISRTSLLGRLSREKIGLVLPRRMPWATQQPMVSLKITLLPTLWSRTMTLKREFSTWSRRK